MSKQRPSQSKRAVTRALRKATAAVAVAPLALGIPVAAHAVVVNPVSGAIDSLLQDLLGGQNLKVGQSVTLDLAEAFADADSYLVYVQNKSVADVTTLSGDLYIGAKKEGTTLVTVTAYDGEQQPIGDERFRLTIDANSALDADGNGFDIQDAAKTAQAMTGLPANVKKEATRTVLRSAESFLELPNREPKAHADGGLVEIAVPEMSSHLVYLDEYFSDPDGDRLEYSIVQGFPSSNAVGGIYLNGEDGILTVDAYGYNASSTTGTILATDPDGLSVTQTFNLTLSDEDLPPFIEPVEDRSTVAGSPIEFVVYVTEHDGDAVTLTGTSDNPSLIPDERIEIMQGNEYFLIMLAPEPGQHGTAIITLTATDGTGQSSARSFVFTVNEQAVPFKDPSASLSATVQTGDHVVLGASALTFFDSDQTGPDDMTYTIVDLPQNGSLRLDDVTMTEPYTFTQSAVNMDRLTYVHNGSETISDSFTFQVSNGSVTTQLYQFEIAVASFSVTELVGQLQSGEWMVRPSQHMVINLNDMFTESPNGNLTYAITSDNANSYQAIGGNAYKLGADNYTVTASDSSGAELSATFTVYADGQQDLNDVTIALGDMGFEAFTDDYFTVPSGDGVGYAVEIAQQSTTEPNAEVMFEATQLYIIGYMEGWTEVNVTAASDYGLSIVDSFTVHVSPIVVTNNNPVSMSEDGGTYYGEFDLTDIFANAVDYRFAVSGNAAITSDSESVPTGIWRSEMAPALQELTLFEVQTNSLGDTITIDARDENGRIVSYKLYLEV